MFVDSGGSTVCHTQATNSSRCVKSRLKIAHCFTGFWYSCFMKFFVSFRIFSTELLWVGISCNFKILLIAALRGYGYLYFEFWLPVEMEKFLLVKMDWTKSLPFCYWLKWHKFWILLFKFIKLSNQKIAKLSFQSVFRKVCPFSVGYFRSSFWSTFAIF